MKGKKFKRIIIARTDSIGDMMLTLPLCGMIREFFPDVHITMIGRTYTEPVVSCCIHINSFCNWDEMEKKSPADQIDVLKKINADAIIHAFPVPNLVWLAKRAAIPMRIATAGRFYTISKCNYPVFFSRKRSKLHEAQLNMKLLGPLGIQKIPSLKDIPAYYGFKPQGTLRGNVLSLVDRNRINLVLHPLSKGSAVEWGIHNFISLVELLPRDRFNVFFTGTENEGVKIRPALAKISGIHDLTGRMTLSEFILFISNCDAMVAASTGPLHIAAASDLFTIGLYSPKRPIFPERWAPLGKRAMFITAEKHPIQHELDINPGLVADYLREFAEGKAKMN